MGQLRKTTGELLILNDEDILVEEVFRDDKNQGITLLIKEMILNSKPPHNFLEMLITDLSACSSIFQTVSKAHGHDFMGMNNSGIQKILNQHWDNFVDNELKGTIKRLNPPATLQIFQIYLSMNEDECYKFIADFLKTTYSKKTISRMYRNLKYFEIN